MVGAPTYPYFMAKTGAFFFFTFAALFGTVFFYAQLLQTALGYGPLGAGLRLLPYTATFMTVAPRARPPFLSRSR